MTWITWRRYRARIILLGLYVVALVVDMPLTERAYQVAVRAAHGEYTSGGGTPLNSALSHASVVDVGLALLPFVIGLVLGAPLVATEFERKTNRIAWLQGVTRTRWLLTTWATLAVPTVLVMALLSPLVQWWASHTVSSFSSGGGLIQPMQMDVSGVAPIALALFTLTFGMFIGIVVRRYFSPYPTSVLGLAVVMGVMPTRILSSLAPKVVVPQTLGRFTMGPSLGSNPWFLWNGYQRPPGFRAGLHTRTVHAVVSYCSNPLHASKYSTGGQGYWYCLKAHSVQLVNTYQPASHYWTLQLREAGIYVVLAALLLGLSVWSVRRWSA
jgi:hypothetical protein